MLQKLLRCLALTIAICAVGWAQDTATISGTVTDPTGAAVANAQVVVVNVANNFETTTETNAEGLYRLPFLRPATYRVRITASGFKRFVRDNIELRVGNTLPINA